MDAFARFLSLVIAEGYDIAADCIGDQLCEMPHDGSYYYSEQLQDLRLAMAQSIIGRQDALSNYCANWNEICWSLRSSPAVTTDESILF